MAASTGSATANSSDAGTFADQTAERTAMGTDVRGPESAGLMWMLMGWVDDWERGDDGGRDREWEAGLRELGE